MCRQGEIDIIARDTLKKEIVFIEVKTRTSQKYGSPSEAVDEHKQKYINQQNTMFTDTIYIIKQ